MKGIHLECPNRKCRKPLFKNVYLRPGSFLTAKCFYCGAMVRLDAEPGKVNLRLLNAPVEKVDLTDDEESDMVVLSI